MQGSWSWTTAVQAVWERVAFSQVSGWSFAEVTETKAVTIENAWRNLCIKGGNEVGWNLSYLLNLQKNGCIMLNESMIKNLES